MFFRCKFDVSLRWKSFDVNLMYTYDELIASDVNLMYTYDELIASDDYWRKIILK